MKGLIIKNGYFENPNNQYKEKRLKEEFALRGVEIVSRSALDLLPFTNGEEIHIPDIQGFDFAIDLDKDGYLADAISELMPLFNSAYSLHLSDDKMTTILALHKSGIHTPITIPAPLCYVSSPRPEEVYRFLDQVERRLSYPLVFKANHGSMGKQVVLIHNRQELDRIYFENIHVPHLYERFLAESVGHDYRVMVVGKKVVACMERVNKKDFRSNIALGGIGYDATRVLPDSFKEVAIKACEILDLDYAGIDLAIGKEDTPIFLEANGNAFFTEIEKVTGINIAKALVDHILDALKN